MAGEYLQFMELHNREFFSYNTFFTVLFRSEETLYRYKQSSMRTISP